MTNLKQKLVNWKNAKTLALAIGVGASALTPIYAQDVKNNSRTIILEKNTGGEYIGSKEKEDGIYQVVSCHPYERDISITEDIATMDARNKLLELQNKKADASGTLYGSRVAWRGIKEINGKKYFCVMVE